METRRLQNKSAEEVSKAIQQPIIEKHGIPKRILSDNGLEFNNENVKNLVTNQNVL